MAEVSDMSVGAEEHLAIKRNAAKHQYGGRYRARGSDWSIRRVTLSVGNVHVGGLGNVESAKSQ
jgi:hypothetical protein